MIVDHYTQLKEEIIAAALECGRDPKDIQLVAVSKNQPWEIVDLIYQDGCREFGENRVQEALEKIVQAPQDCHWHFIGALQKNKVRKVIQSPPKFFLIHSVDSKELAEKISEVSIELKVKTRILLQINTSGELSKQGMTTKECWRDFDQIRKLSGITVQGLMTMAPLVEDEEVIRKTFRDLRILRDALIEKYQIKLPYLSMGMSHDYKIAIQEGATLLRIGSKIWK